MRLLVGHNISYAFLNETTCRRHNISYAFLNETTCKRHNISYAFLNEATCRTHNISYAYVFIPHTKRLHIWWCKIWPATVGKISKHRNALIFLTNIYYGIALLFIGHCGGISLTTSMNMIRLMIKPQHSSTILLLIVTYIYILAIPIANLCCGSLI